MIIYDIFFLLFSIIYLPYLIIKGKAHRDFAQRFGRLPPVFEEIGSSRPIWIHAVSVGEVLAVKNFMGKLSANFHRKKVVLSTTTKTGNSVAGRLFSEDVLKFYFPLDFSFVVRHVVDFINPAVFIAMETEIWPNLILELSRRKIPIVLLNGRISDKSFKGYRKIKFFFNDILKRIDIFCMQTSSDARRIEDLGVPRKNVRITGNMKFDVEEEENVARTKSDLGIDEHCQLLVAGSTHRGEEEIVLDVYQNLAEEFQNLKLLIAPRHIDRAEVIKNLVEQKGLQAVLLSQEREWLISEKTVLILDTLGELSQLYSLATIVFMGGSLIKRGGHNLVEPAIFGKPIVFGPYMFNFRDMAKLFLEDNAAIEVKNRKELLETLKALLRDKEKRDNLGAGARKLIDRQRGATERNIREVERFIKQVS